MSSFTDLLFNKPPKNLLEGFGVLPKGLRYALAHKNILVLALIPIFLSSLVLYLSFTPMYQLAFDKIQQYLFNEAWFNFFGGSILRWIVLGFYKVSTTIFILLFFYVLLQIIYIPFCSYLAEKILRGRGIVELESIKDTIRFNLGMFKVGIVKAVILIVASLTCFVFSFLPVLNFLPLYFALLVLAYDSFDYGLELYGLKLGDRIYFFKKEYLYLNGHASMLFLLSFIPGFLLLTLPFSVIGASAALGDFYEIKRKTT